LGEYKKYIYTASNTATKCGESDPLLASCISGVMWYLLEVWTRMNLVGGLSCVSLINIGGHLTLSFNSANIQHVVIFFNIFWTLKLRWVLNSRHVQCPVYSSMSETHGCSMSDLTSMSKARRCWMPYLTSMSKICWMFCMFNVRFNFNVEST
jgi:hypothetical protein